MIMQHEENKEIALAPQKLELVKEKDNTKKETKEEELKNDELTDMILDPFSYYIKEAIKSLKLSELSVESKKCIVFEILDMILINKVSNQSLKKNLPKLYFLFDEEKSVYQAFMTLLGNITHYNSEIQEFLSTKELYNHLDFKEKMTYYLIKTIRANNEITNTFFLENIYDEEIMGSFDLSTNQKI